MSNSRKFRYIDLFAGAGGLSEGFLMQGDFLPLAHIEMNKDACSTIKTRLCYYYLKENNKIQIYNSYLKGEISREKLYEHVPFELLESVINTEIKNETIDSIFNQIDKIIKNNETHIDLIVGGPPCQAYSVIGRSVSKTKMIDDPRNILYKQYVKFLQKYRPRMFIFENVPGILTANNGKTIVDILRAFREIGYNADYRIQNSNKFGVLQSRKRVIIIGWQIEYKIDYPSFPIIRNDGIMVSDLLKDLPIVDRGSQSNIYLTDSSDYLKSIGIRNEQDILTWHETRNINDNDIRIYWHVINAWNKEQRRMSYKDLPDNLKKHKNTNSFMDRFKVLASDLPYAHTMIAHLAKDGHHFIHPDINQCRSITVREAARIQSFPDNFYFEGSRTSAFTQIGNAVPPLMAFHLANQILILLSKMFVISKNAGKDYE